MSTVTSKDGTTIAYDRKGEGPALILVDGALCYRAMGPMGPLSELLSKRFTVYTYDRRGRGESGDTQPYEPEREYEDLEALINEAGGSAMVYGISSGATLAVNAAAHGLAIDRLALYESPFIVDHSRPAAPADYTDHLDELKAADKRGDMVSYFMRKAVKVPAPVVWIMRVSPAWKKMTAVAPTLTNDARVMGDTQSGEPLPAGRWDSARMPTLVAWGGKSPAWMINANRALAEALPQAEQKVIPGQNHMIKAAPLAPVLEEFFSR
jgi:pimeloyl-ACP methyl ester carboxylesterase